MVRFGRVKYFDPHPKKQCGEVTVLDERDCLTGEVLPFCRNKLHVVRFDQPWNSQNPAPRQGPWWRGPIHGHPTRNRHGRSARLPRRHDLIVFDATTCGGRITLERWAFVDKHDREAYDELRARGLVAMGLNR